MSLINRLKRIGLDAYLLLLIATVLLATVLPARGEAAAFVAQLAYYAVALLFFVYGAKLNTRAVFQALARWRMQSLVIIVTYIVFPVLGLSLVWLLSSQLSEPLLLGLLFLTLVPSTVQSSIAFTSLAHGNVPDAVCAASLSNLVGVVLTPLLAAVLLKTEGEGVSTDAIKAVSIQILLPFIAGQFMRPLIGNWIARNKGFTLTVDRGSILLIVYSAFSAGMVTGVWSMVDGRMLAVLVAACALMFATAMLIITIMNRLGKLAHGDRVVMLFCGSTKSLASGVPIANILFAGQAVSLIILPLMIYHQIQLFVCAIMAQRFSQQYKAEQAAV